jgi:cell division protein FtsW
LGVGLVLLLCAACTPLKVWEKVSGWLYVGAVLLCGVVLIPGVGHYVGGARRWLVWSFVTLQPSEWSKYAVMVLVAALLAGRGVYGRGWGQERLALPFVLAQIPIGLILAEPDLGTALVLEMVVLMMVFVGGIRARVFVWFGVLSLPVLYHVLLGTPFRLRRLLGYLDPWAYRSSVGYQVTEALISIGSGGMTGVGLGDGKQKLFFLPEAHTDFIFAVLAEELGWVGVCVLLCGFGVLVWRGARLALLADRPFQRYVALGTTLLIGVPAVFNVCVVTGLLPTKGLPLPLVSYGGSHTVMAMMGIGLLLRVSREQGVQR